MSREFLDRLREGSLTNSENFVPVTSDTVSSRLQVQKGAIGRQWQNWELAPEWNSQQHFVQQDGVFGGEKSVSIAAAIQRLDSQLS